MLRICAVTTISIKKRKARAEIFWTTKTIENNKVRHNNKIVKIFIFLGIALFSV